MSLDTGFFIHIMGGIRNKWVHHVSIRQAGCRTLQRDAANSMAVGKRPGRFSQGSYPIARLHKVALGRS
jgi:hypothetical protein